MVSYRQKGIRHIKLRNYDRRTIALQKLCAEIP